MANAGDRASHRRIWSEEILTFNVNDSWSRILQVYKVDACDTVEELVLKQRPWTSWAYQAAYPRLSAFLKSIHLRRALVSDRLQEQSRVELYLEDFVHLPEPCIIRSWSWTKGVLDATTAWDNIKDRLSVLDEEEDIDPSSSVTRFIPYRSYRIVDISPFLAAAILESTPRINTSHVAQFFERHLQFINYAKVDLLNPSLASRVPGLNKQPFFNSFKMEYHFAFYYVPRVSMDPQLVISDYRHIRKTVSFEPGFSIRKRFIYEEQLSFLLIGYGNDLYTSFQLAEKYFLGPYIKDLSRPFFIRKPYNPNQYFLRWIAFGFHHVLFRWQGAIAAVDEKIDSPSDVIFMDDDDKTDLMADDPHFTKSKTYFWALQSYTLFEDKMYETIKTWRKFEKEELAKLYDGRIEEEEWDECVHNIESAISELQQKIHHIQKMVSQVKALQEGLFSASALFDSRTAVRQGDNIRLLTYITMLFLPLSFCTSVFGMQTVLPPTLGIHTFAITLSVVTVATAMILFNLKNISELFELTMTLVTDRLRTRMRAHQRKHWTKQEVALHFDRAATKNPVRKAHRQTSHWAYAAFAAEMIFVTLPVHEIKAAVDMYGWRSLGSPFHKERRRLSEIEAGTVIESSGKSSGNVRAQKILEMRKTRARHVLAADEKFPRVSGIAKEKPPKIFRSTGEWLSRIVLTMFFAVRLLFLIVWIPLVLIELVLTLLYWNFKSNLRSLILDKDDPILKAKPSRTPWQRTMHTLGLSSLNVAGHIVAEVGYDPSGFPSPDTPVDPLILRRSTSIWQKGANLRSFSKDTASKVPDSQRLAVVATDSKGIAEHLSPAPQLTTIDEVFGPVEGSNSARRFSKVSRLHASGLNRVGTDLEALEESSAEPNPNISRRHSSGQDQLGNG